MKVSLHYGMELYQDSEIEVFIKMQTQQNNAINILRSAGSYRSLFH